MKLKLFDISALLVSASLFLLFSFYTNTRNSDETYLHIQDEKGEYLYPLNKDLRISFEGPIGESVILIENGTARFEHSACEDHLCEMMGAISKEGEWAACLPNRIFLLIESERDKVETDTLSY